MKVLQSQSCQMSFDTLCWQELFLSGEEGEYWCVWTCFDWRAKDLVWAYTNICIHLRGTPLNMWADSDKGRYQCKVHSWVAVLCLRFLFLLFFFFKVSDDFPWQYSTKACSIGNNFGVLLLALSYCGVVPSPPRKLSVPLPLQWSRTEV